MGELVRVVGGRHRRPPDDDGQAQIYETGDVFEATETELEAFGDKFERVEEADDGSYESVESSAPPEEAGEYRLVRGRHRKVVDGEPVVYEAGDVVALNEAEVEAFGDKFEHIEDDADEDDGDESDAADEEGDADESGDGDLNDQADVDESAEREAEDSEDESEGDEEEAEESAGGEISVPEDFEYELPEDFPNSFPDAYPALQRLATANGIEGQQSKADLLDALEARRED